MHSLYYVCIVVKTSRRSNVRLALLHTVFLSCWMMGFLIFLFCVGEVVTLFDMSNSNLFPVSLHMDCRLHRVRPSLSSFIRSCSSWRFLVIYIEHTSLSAWDGHKKIFHLQSTIIYLYLVSWYVLVFWTPSWNHLWSSSLNWCPARFRRDYSEDGAKMERKYFRVKRTCARSRLEYRENSFYVSQISLSFGYHPSYAWERDDGILSRRITDDPAIDGVDTDGLVYDVFSRIVFIKSWRRQNSRCVLSCTLQITRVNITSRSTRWSNHALPVRYTLSSALSKLTINMTVKRV